MAAKRKQGKWTAGQIEEHVQRIQKAIKTYKRKDKNWQIAAITPEQIRKKLTRVNSPILTFHGWNSQPANGKIHIDLGVDNPDPTAVTDLYVLIWVGTGYADPTPGTYLLNVDTRFPRLVQPNIVGAASFGLILAAGTSTILHFDLPVASTVPKTNYITNICLMHLPAFDDPLLLDRSVLAFNVP